VVALDPLLEVLGYVMDGIACQVSLLSRRLDGGRVRAGAVGADPVGRQQRPVLEHLAEEPFGGLEITLGGQQEVDRLAILVDGPVQVPPLASDPDVGLVNADRPQWGLRNGRSRRSIRGA